VTVAEQESQGNAVLRSILSASAGAAAVFVLDRAFFKKDANYIVAQMDTLERRIDRLEAMALRAKIRRDGLPAASSDEIGVDRDSELFRKLAPDYGEVDFDALEIDDD
jgi:hypothetical protein